MFKHKNSEYKFIYMGLHRWQCWKNQPANAGASRDLVLIPGLGRSSGEWNGNPYQDSCLENSLDRGAWWAIVHGVAVYTHIYNGPIQGLEIKLIFIDLVNTFLYERFNSPLKSECWNTLFYICLEGSLNITLEAHNKKYTYTCTSNKIVCFKRPLLLRLKSTT